MADASCLFCRIVARQIPATIVAESDDCLAFRDLNPQAPLHVLVIPKRHVASLDAAAATDDALLGRMALLAAEVARGQGVAAAGYRAVINTNADAGQTVFHVHLHLLAGRRLGWPPG